MHSSSSWINVRKDVVNGICSYQFLSSVVSVSVNWWEIGKVLAIRCALTFWNPFFAVGLPQTVYAFNDVHVFSINHVQDCCRIDAYKSRHYLTSICCLWEFQVHPDKNWPFCLINPLAKWPESFATFRIVSFLQYPFLSSRVLLH